MMFLSTTCTEQTRKRRSVSKTKQYLVSRLPLVVACVSLVLAGADGQAPFVLPGTGNAVSPVSAFRSSSPDVAGTSGFRSSQLASSRLHAPFSISHLSPSNTFSQGSRSVQQSSAASTQKEKLSNEELAQVKELVKHISSKDAQSLRKVHADLGNAPPFRDLYNSLLLQLRAKAAIAGRPAPPLLLWPALPPSTSFLSSPSSSPSRSDVAALPAQQFQPRSSPSARSASGQVLLPAPVETDLAPASSSSSPSSSLSSLSSSSFSSPAVDSRLRSSRLQQQQQLKVVGQRERVAVADPGSPTSSSWSSSSSSAAAAAAAEPWRLEARKLPRDLQARLKVVYDRTGDTAAFRVMVAQAAANYQAVVRSTGVVDNSAPMVSQQEKVRLLQQQQQQEQQQQQQEEQLILEQQQQQQQELQRLRQHNEQQKQQLLRIQQQNLLQRTSLQHGRGPTLEETSGAADPLGTSSMSADSTMVESAALPLPLAPPQQQQTSLAEQQRLNTPSPLSGPVRVVGQHMRNVYDPSAPQLPEANAQSASRGVQSSFHQTRQPLQEQKRVNESTVQPETPASPSPSHLRITIPLDSKINVLANGSVVVVSASGEVRPLSEFQTSAPSASFKVSTLQDGSTYRKDNLNLEDQQRNGTAQAGIPIAQGGQHSQILQAPRQIAEVSNGPGISSQVLTQPQHVGGAEGTTQQLLRGREAQVQNPETLAPATQMASTQQPFAVLKQANSSIVPGDTSGVTRDASLTSAQTAFEQMGRFEQLSQAFILSQMPSDIASNSTLRNMYIAMATAAQQKALQPSPVTATTLQPPPLQRSDLSSRVASPLVVVLSPESAMMTQHSDVTALASLLSDPSVLTLVQENPQVLSLLQSNPQVLTLLQQMFPSLDRGAASQQAVVIQAPAFAPAATPAVTPQPPPPSSTTATTPTTTTTTAPQLPTTPKRSPLEPAVSFTMSLPESAIRNGGQRTMGVLLQPMISATIGRSDTTLTLLEKFKNTLYDTMTSDPRSYVIVDEHSWGQGQGAVHLPREDGGPTILVKELIPGYVAGHMDMTKLPAAQSSGLIPVLQFNWMFEVGTVPQTVTEAVDIILAKYGRSETTTTTTSTTTTLANPPQLPFQQKTVDNSVLQQLMQFLRNSISGQSSPSISSSNLSLPAAAEPNTPPVSKTQVNSATGDVMSNLGTQAPTRTLLSTRSDSGGNEPLTSLSVDGMQQPAGISVMSTSAAAEPATRFVWKSGNAQTSTHSAIDSTPAPSSQPLVHVEATTKHGPNFIPWRSVTTLAETHPAWSHQQQERKPSTPNPVPFNNAALPVRVFAEHVVITTEKMHKPGTENKSYHKPEEDGNHAQSGENSLASDVGTSELKQLQPVAATSPRDETGVNNPQSFLPAVLAHNFAPMAMSAGLLSTFLPTINHWKGGTTMKSLNNIGVNSMQDYWNFLSGSGPYRRATTVPPTKIIEFRPNSTLAPSASAAKQEINIINVTTGSTAESSSLTAPQNSNNTVLNSSLTSTIPNQTYHGEAHDPSPSQSPAISVKQQQPAQAWVSHQTTPPSVPANQPSTLPRYQDRTKTPVETKAVVTQLHTQSPTSLQPTVNPMPTLQQTVQNQPVGHKLVTPTLTVTQPIARELQTITTQLPPTGTAKPAVLIRSHSLITNKLPETVLSQSLLTKNQDTERVATLATLPQELQPAAMPLPPTVGLPASQQHFPRPDLVPLTFAVKTVGDETPSQMLQQTENGEKLKPSFPVINQPVQSISNTNISQQSPDLLQPPAANLVASFDSKPRQEPITSNDRSLVRDNTVDPVKQLQHETSHIQPVSNTDELKSGQQRDRLTSLENVQTSQKAAEGELSQTADKVDYGKLLNWLQSNFPSTLEPQFIPHVVPLKKHLATTPPSVNQLLAHPVTSLPFPALPPTTLPPLCPPSHEIKCGPVRRSNRMAALCELKCDLGTATCDVSVCQCSCVAMVGQLSLQLAVKIATTTTTTEAPTTKYDPEKEAGD